MKQTAVRCPGHHELRLRHAEKESKELKLPNIQGLAPRVAATVGIFVRRVERTIESVGHECGESTCRR